jgi:hypothetical protein
MSERPLFVALLGYVYGRAGEGQKSRRILKELTVRSAQEYVSPIDFAIVHAGLGDANSMFHWFEVAYQAHSARIHELSWLYFDSFRLDPRYIDLKRRIASASVTGAIDRGRARGRAHRDQAGLSSHDHSFVPSPTSTPGRFAADLAAQLKRRGQPSVPLCRARSDRVNRFAQTQRH